MKVLHVIARFNVGGTATYLYNLFGGLTGLGIETLLVVGKVPNNEQEESRIREIRHIRVSRLSREISPIKDFLAYRQIQSVVRDFRPDIIHSHTFKAGFLMRIGRQSIPVIHTFHGHHLYDPEFGRFSRLVMNLTEKTLAKRTSRILTIGKKVGEELLHQGIGKPDQFISIPPGIKSLDFDKRDLLRGKFRIGPSEFLVVWLGRFTKVKRPDVVIEVARKLPHLNFVMAGDGELRKNLELQAPANLRILGLQNASEMWGIADLALLTSDSEGMPLSVIEAQMSGLPVVATNVGSVSEIVEDGVTGILTDADVGQISTSIAELAANPLKLKRMGKASELRARTLFAREVMARKHLEVYDVILGKVRE